MPARNMVDIDVEELSLVDVPAIFRRKFLLIKRNSEVLKDEYLVCPDCGFAEGVNEDGSCDESECPECGATLVGFTTKILKKGSENKVDKLLELLIECFGEEDINKEEFSKAAEIEEKTLEEIKGAVELIAKYKENLPDDLKKAVSVLAKHASYPEEKEDLKKAGKKLSKDSIAIITKAVEALDALKSLLSEEDQAALKKAKELINAKELAKKVEEMDEEMEKKLKEKDDTIIKLEKRLDVLEKEHPGKKKIDGQDDEGGDDDEGKDKDKVKKKDGFEWTSFKAE